MEKNKKKEKSLSSAIQLKNGSYSIVMTVIVLTIIVVINLIVGQLPEKNLTIDLTETGIFSITDTSKSFLNSLEKDVNVEVVAETGNVDSRIEKFMSIYDDLSSHVTVSYIDPVLHPEVLTEYGISTNSVVVSCEETGKNQVISFNDIIVSQYNYYGYSTESEFDAEGQLTSAISAVTTDSDKKIYMLRGHGESAFSQELGGMLTKNSMTTSNLNLLDTANIPDDCDLLVINSPSSDLGTDEYTEIHNYLYKGGNVLLIRGVTEKKLPNFDELMEDYGMTMVNSYIGDRERYYQRANSAFYFFPLITSNDVNVDTSSTILVGAVAGMTQSETIPQDVSLTTLLTTSTSAFTEGNSTETSKFILAAAAKKSVTKEEEEQTTLESESEEVKEQPAPEDKMEYITVGTGEGWMEEPTAESALTVITAPSMIDSSVTGNFSGIENLNEIINIISSYFEDVQNVSISAKSLSVNYNTVTGGGIWNILLIGIIPVFSIICGLVVWIRRRKA